MRTWSHVQEPLPKDQGMFLVEVGYPEAARPMERTGTAPPQPAPPPSPPQQTRIETRVADFQPAAEVRARRRNPSRAARPK